MSQHLPVPACRSCVRRATRPALIAGFALACSLAAVAADAGPLGTKPTVVASVPDADLLTALGLALVGGTFMHRRATTKRRA